MPGELSLIAWVAVGQQALAVDLGCLTHVRSFFSFWFFFCVWFLEWGGVEPAAT